MGSRKTGRAQGPGSARGLPDLGVGGHSCSLRPQAGLLLREHSPNCPRHLARPQTNSPCQSLGQHTPLVLPCGPLLVSQMI